MTEINRIEYFCKLGQVEKHGNIETNKVKLTCMEEYCRHHVANEAMDNYSNWLMCGNMQSHSRLSQWDLADRLSTEEPSPNPYFELETIFHKIQLLVVPNDQRHFDRDNQCQTPPINLRCERVEVIFHI